MFDEVVGCDVVGIEACVPNVCVLNSVQLNIVCSGVSSSPALQCTQVGESFLPMRKRYAWKDPCPVNACVM